MKLKLFFFQSLIIAQSIQVGSSLDTLKSFIGENIYWSIEVRGAERKRIKYPKLEDIDDVLNFKRLNNKREELNNNQIKYEITAWDTGVFSTPEYSIEILDSSGKVDFILEVPKIKFNIISILDSLDEKNYRPFKGPVPVKDIWPIKTSILCLGILLILYLILIIWKKREKTKFKKIDYSYIENPKERALRRLDNLSTNFFSKDFYTSLSHISREYIETKFFIRVLEMDTEQIKKTRIIFPIDDDIFYEWLLFLSYADKVKYARELPSEKRMIEDKDKIIFMVKTLK